MAKIHRRGAGAGLAALAILVAGCSSSGSARPPRTTAHVTALRSSCTEQITLASPAGQMHGCVHYSYAHGLLKVTAASAAYASSSGYDLPYFTFTFREPASAVIDYKFSTPVVDAENVLSHSTGLIDLARTGEIHADDSLQITLRATSASSGEVVQMASVTLTLYPRGLRCPDLGPDAGFDEETGQC
jgi:hypothetical protein